MIDLKQIAEAAAQQAPQDYTIPWRQPATPQGFKDVATARAWMGREAVGLEHDYRLDDIPF